MRAGKSVCRHLMASETRY